MQISAAKTAVDLAGRYPLPNLVELMSSMLEHTSPPVRLTRRTLLELFRRLHDKKAALDNPHEWASVAVHVLKDRLADHLVSGIHYRRLDEWYEMRQILNDDAVELFSKYVVKVDDSRDKSIYDLVPCDSEIERQFVKDLESREDVRLYIKLPHWFVVPTPVGDYQPDWAIVMDCAEPTGEPVLYLVTETKGSAHLDDLRPDEQRRIRCGAAHFGSKQFQKKGALDGVDYRVVTSAAELSG